MIRKVWRGRISNKPYTSLFKIWLDEEDLALLYRFRAVLIAWNMTEREWLMKMVAEVIRKMPLELVTGDQLHDYSHIFPNGQMLTASGMNYYRKNRWTEGIEYYRMAKKGRAEHCYDIEKVALFFMKRHKEHLAKIEAEAAYRAIPVRTGIRKMGPKGPWKYKDGLVDPMAKYRKKKVYAEPSEESERNVNVSPSR